MPGASNRKKYGRKRSSKHAKSSSQPKIKKRLLPGIGRPLSYVPDSGAPDYVADLFKNALSIEDLGIFEERRMSARLQNKEPEHTGPNVAQQTLTLRELEMLRFMNSVTDKSNWFNKVNNEEIARKWKDEVCGSGLDFTHQMADCCIEELRYVGSIYAASPENPPPILVYNGDVVKSDTAVSPALKHALQEEVNRFEAAIPTHLKDWHPGSDGKVLDLVHPSLFPLVYGKTRVLREGETTTLLNCIERCGEGETVPLPPDEQTFQTFQDDWRMTQKYRIFSNRFQWLPCEVDISREHVKITSYINNLHPREVRLYGLIEKLIDASIPLWNISLAPLADVSFVRYTRIPYTIVEYDPDPEFWPESEQAQRLPGESDNDFWNRRYEWTKETRRLVFPEPEEFDLLPQPAPFDLRGTYGKRGLQVIVKLASIHLTPEKPEYEGGTWHVEGQMNEHIVASSLYYYSTENITTSVLSFRQLCDRTALEANVAYTQFDDEWLTHIFGCQNEKEAVQYLGSVETREGRLLTFPNILHHRVEPFKLADPTRPGHRKIVALFLVDPNITIASTAHIPCQQQEWWWEAVMTPEVQPTSSAAVGRVPLELQDAILEDVDFPFSLKEAKALRLELMEERKDFRLRHGEALDQVTFSLCEH